jgi:hypothetical protein
MWRRWEKGEGARSGYMWAVLHTGSCSCSEVGVGVMCCFAPGPRLRDHPDGPRRRHGQPAGHPPPRPHYPRRRGAHHPPRPPRLHPPVAAGQEVQDPEGRGAGAGQAQEPGGVPGVPNRQYHAPGSALGRSPVVGGPLPRHAGLRRAPAHGTKRGIFSSRRPCTPMIEVLDSN